MRDLSWLSFEVILLIVANGDKVLIREPNKFPIFQNVLNDVSRYWAEPIRQGQWWDHEPRPFHTILILPDNYNGARGVDLIYD
jgi:hypothetical protein